MLRKSRVSFRDPVLIQGSKRSPGGWADNSWGMKGGRPHFDQPPTMISDLKMLVKFGLRMPASLNPFVDAATTFEDPSVIECKKRQDLRGKHDIDPTLRHRKRPQVLNLFCKACNMTPPL